jgi:hypothetical protein
VTINKKEKVMKKATLINLNLLLITLVFCANSQAQSSAIYNVSFQSTWNASEHTSIPSGDHYSNLVGGTHKNKNEFFQVGELASNGIKNVAELGNNVPFMNEVQNSSNSKEWFEVFFSPNNAEFGSATISNIEVTEEHHLLTLVSMIAPSPDWFIALNSIDLRNDTNTDWKQTFTVDAFVYDSGTDSGENYNSANSPTPSPELIYKINSAPFNGIKVGTFTIAFVSSTLSTPEFQAANNSLKLYPNPTKGNVTLIGESVANLKTVDIYNVLGSKVKTLTISAKNNRFEMNLNSLSKGIYILKLNDSNGNSKSQKLILE